MQNIIELPPSLDDQLWYDFLISAPSADAETVIRQINENYEYWDVVKYKYRERVDGYTPETLWHYAHIYRDHSRQTVWEKYNVTFSLTNKMQRVCHEFDMNFGGSWTSSSIIPLENKEQYLISSQMEEAIFSSQIEGAATTRQVAKDMLRKKQKPKDRSQQMIYNNYATILNIKEHLNEPFSAERLLELHRLMTNGTLENPEDAGRFRQNNNVVVEDGITHRIVHTPPPYDEIPEFVNTLKSFFNDTNPSVFIHPIIRGIIIHYMLTYVHPFADGNGRTARALFYWYMLKQNYWLTEFLSISRVIIGSKKKYEKAYICSEADHNDMGYFIDYNLEVLAKAFKKLQEYLNRKAVEKRMANTFLRLGNINNRQAMVIKMFYDNPKEVITVKDLEGKFRVTAATAKSDIVGLMQRGFLGEVSFNKVKKGYVKGEQFDELIKQVSL